jgi:tRNA-dihydrouridine synthase
MEGVTGDLFRNAHAAVFGPADQYLTPFLAPNQNLRLTTRELQDVLPEHNEGLNVVPQLLTSNADHFVWCAKELAAMGYRQVNLNLGCPSGTVVAKGKGAGFLASPERLDRFLDQIFSQLTVDISVKTRVGKTSADEFDRLLEIFGRYPIRELIVHPRVQTDFYRGKPDLSAFGKAVERSPAPVCYNGDLFSVAALSVFTTAFPQVDRVMAGRGVVADPSLLRQFRGGTPASKDELREFHERLYAGYRQVMPGERAVLARMKELWSYLLFSFTGREQYIRPLRKASRLSEYEDVIAAVFREQEVIPGGSFDPACL